MFPAKTFAKKRVAVFGLARSGISCATALHLGGAEVFAWDDSEPAVEKAKASGVNITSLHSVDFNSLDALVLSPGVPLTHPEPHWTVVKARQANIEIIGDTEIFARELTASGAKLVAITGTNGKSTTTALVGHVLKSAGLAVHVGGNIGLAVFNLPKPEAGSIYVLELSSFQIDLMPSLKPDVGILTNITPDHLDRHGTLENYAKVKGRLFAHMTAGCSALVSVDDGSSNAIASQINSPICLQRVSVRQSLEDGICAPNGILEMKQSGNVVESLDLRDFSALRGRHNWQNACMAYGVARHFGVSVQQTAMAMKDFPGLAHRMQKVAQLGPVSFVNDSKATNADAAEKALSSYDNIHWIAGGISKTGGIDSLAPFFPRIHRAYLIGAAANEFSAALAGKADFVMSETLEVAVSQAAHDASLNEKPNPVVLLSPACASFDHFKNFEIRGNAFVDLVSKIPNVVMQKGSLQ